MTKALTESLKKVSQGYFAGADLPLCGSMLTMTTYGPLVATLAVPDDDYRSVSDMSAFSAGPRNGVRQRRLWHDNGMITMAITIPGSPSPRLLNAAIHWAVGRAGKGRLTSKSSKATLTSCGIRSGSSAPSGRCPRPR
jgi:hypothetical protein